MFVCILVLQSAIVTYLWFFLARHADFLERHESRRQKGSVGLTLTSRKDKEEPELTLRPRRFAGTYLCRWFAYLLTFLDLELLRSGAAGASTSSTLS